MKISVIGLGYVGISMAVLLSRKHHVVAMDIDQSKVDAINEGISPIRDAEISRYLKDEILDLSATSSAAEALEAADYIIIATPTNYDPDSNKFDTSSVDSVITQALSINDKATIIIKSTIPVGYTDACIKKYNYDAIIFSPEFLREGQALYDNLHPSRIIVGDLGERGKAFAQILANCALDQDPPILQTSPNEAEAIKLFSNTYLAMRIAYFNELDSYAESHNLNSKRIIEGVCLDPRIGMHYNNPSFGYGGYCLPKDTKQLLANYQEIPNDLIAATVKSNNTRKNFITASIIAKQPSIVGIYRLIMKNGSDNFRDSSVLDIIKNLKEHNIQVIVFEPTLKAPHFMGATNIEDLEAFTSKSDIILANRTSSELDPVAEKVYTRDVFKNN
ncbi:nucleotide sugar dehydrogenase [Pseudomonas fulva]|uniref:nucleotide sugar dehydrogenase n=1 Tax=Pseudomonas fulva TaxID=47880 RepID=UPI0032ECBCF5